MLVGSYPARGAVVVPATFNAGTYGYLMLALLPVAAVIWFGIAVGNIHPTPTWLFLGLAISVGALFAVFTSLRKLNIEIRIDGISYTNLLGRTRFVSYGGISSVVLVDYRHASSEATPRRSLRSWTAIITSGSGIETSVLYIPLTLFPDSARREFVRMFKPEERESGT
jgi:hypothetical protein